MGGYVGSSDVISYVDVSSYIFDKGAYAGPLTMNANSVVVASGESRYSALRCRMWPMRMS